MTAPLGLPEASDAELVERVLQADREAFAVVYDRYGPRLYDFAYSMLRQREDAADAVADSFVTFAEKLPQLRDPDRLRPWLYAIVRSECLRRLKQRTRVSYGDDDQLAAIADDAMTPDEAAEKAALQKLVWDAAAGLADRDRALLDLHLRQGLEGAELGEAMGVSASNAYVMLNRLRTQVDRSLGALLIARLGREDCDELDGLLGDWDGSFSPLIRKRVARHVEGCSICGERRKRMLSPWMLLAGVPLFAAPAALRDRVVNDTQLVAYSGPPTSGPGGRWNRRRTAASAVAAAVVIGGTALLWPHDDDPASADQPIGATSAPGTPTATSTLTTAPATSAPASAARSATPAQAGKLTVSTQAINLGTTRTSGHVIVTNTGGQAVDFSVSTQDRWLNPSVRSGTLQPGQQAGFTVTADRSDLPEGSSSGTMLIRSDAQAFSVKVSLTEERKPVVGTPTLGTSTCGQSGRLVRVTVPATDPAGISSVKLFFSGAAGGSVTMSRSGSVWVATMGPFPVGGEVTLHATAIDKRGNIGSGPTLRTQVDPCPQ